MPRRKSHQGTAPKEKSRGLEIVIYSTLALHGPLTGVALAAMFDESARRITNALSRLRIKGAIARHGYIPHPEFAVGGRCGLWRIADDAAASDNDETDDPGVSTDGIALDREDLEWATRIAASNALKHQMRSRV